MEVIADQMDADEIEAIQEEVNQEFKDAGIDPGEVLDSARDDLTLWDGYFNENNVRGKDDMNFLLRDQWSAVERSEFTRLFKPAMTFNKLYDTTKKIVGEQRKNKPDLLVRSLTGKATQEQINLRADLVRTISYQSQNDLVYQTAFKSALYMGYGAFEIMLDYESPRSFNQVVKFDLIPDATRTSFDPTAVKPHKGDGNFCARQFIYSKEEFYATYPWVTNAVSYADPRLLLDFQWQTRNTIVVNKYTRKEWFPVKIYFLSNGQVVTEDEWKAMQEDFKILREVAEQSMVVDKMILQQIPTIKAERNTRDYNVRQYMMTQNQIIKFSDWPSKHLPLIFVDGDSNFIEGKQYARSFIHEAKDAQRFVNYVGSEIAAEIKNRRREQWLGTPDNIQGYEQFWRNPELQMGILLAKADPKTGLMPTKQPPWDLSPALLAQFQRGGQDMREILGFSETEEIQGRDMSGKARRERKMEGSMSAYVWFDNLNQAIEQGGRVVLDLLPVIAGEEERHMVISKPDGRTENVILNQQTKDGVANVIEGGEYDIEIDTGPSFAVQREVALEFFQETIANNPQVFNLIADLWAENLDIQSMKLVKDRLKNLVPPQIIAKEEGKELPPQPPSPQEQMMQAEMQMKQAEIKNKMAEVQIKAEKLQLEKEQNELDQMKLMIDMQKAQQDAQLNIFDHKINLAKTVATHSLDKEKHEADFAHKLTQTLADLHKHSTKLDHDKEIAKSKPKPKKS